MPFDDIPEDHKPSYPCENCGEGNITESEDYKGCWECDTCGWSRPVSKRMSSSTPHPRSSL